MDFVLEIKENAEVQERFYGMAKKYDLEVKFKQGNKTQFSKI